MTKPNRLANEMSPYLRQHAMNPVDWYPWGSDAMAKAKRDQKPIFLSIGYSACHWCHVMERESFENAEVAKLLNDHFVSIKVDREERPDLDHIYMSAVQLLTQHGGWPMSVFLTPELDPFYGGTYFPPDDRMGMPGFKKILIGIASAWKAKRNDVVTSAKQLTSALAEMQTASDAKGSGLSMGSLDRAFDAAAENFDPKHGGFGRAPKFFHSMDLKVCLRHWARTGNEQALNIVTTTLDALARGGIYDQLGGGFHRYSTDAHWLVPHFEKMLYDNALLAELFTEGYLATRKVEYAETVRETLDYVLREMTSPEGGFYSTQDADSEGVEGKFYVWQKSEIKKELGDELSDQFCRSYGVTDEGNWEGNTILQRLHPLDDIARATAKRKLLAVRKARVAPFRDEKVIAAWNGLMIHSLATAHQALGDERFLDAARKAAQFILEKMGPGGRGQGELQHVYKDGRAKQPAFLDDYAALCNALTSLYQSDFNETWLEIAQRLADSMLDKFWEKGLFFYTPKEGERLIHRPRENHDGSTPSAGALALTALTRLGHLTARTEYLDRARKGLEALSAQVERVPTASGQLLVALGLHVDRPSQLVVVPGESPEELDAAIAAIRERYLPNSLIAVSTPESRLGWVREKNSRRTAPTLFVCESSACQSPVEGMEAIVKSLDRLGPKSPPPQASH